MLFTGCNREEKHLATTYTDIFQAEKGYIVFSTEYENQGSKTKQAQKIAINGKDIALDVMLDMPSASPLPMRIKLVLKDKIMYIVNYMQQQVITVDLTDDFDEILKRLESNTSYLISAKTKDLSFDTSGNEEFKGEKLYFEQYTTKLGTYKYYFDDKDLVGMSVKIDGLNEPLDLTINEIKKKYPKEMFNIPKEFKKISAEEAGFNFDIDQLFPK